MKQQKYQENQLKHIKGNSHKIKKQAANLQLAFYFMEYNNLAITVQIWKELLSIFKILDVKRTLTRSVYEKLHSNFLYHKVT